MSPPYNNCGLRRATSAICPRGRGCQTAPGARLDLLASVRAPAVVKRERVFKNTFAPSCESQELSASDIVTGMRFGVFKYRHLPLEVRVAVDEEIRRMKEEDKSRDADDWKLKMLDLGMGVAKHEVRRPRATHTKEPVPVAQALSIFLDAGFQKQAVPMRAIWKWQLQDRVGWIWLRRELSPIDHRPYGVQPDMTFVRT